MTGNAEPSVFERNRGLLEAMVTRGGLTRLPPARFRVEGLEAVLDEASVDLMLAVEGRAIRLRFSNRDPSAPAFVRLPSFNVVYLRGPRDPQLESAQNATLTWSLQRLASIDPGSLEFDVPPRAPRPAGPALKLQKVNERAWHRDLFDESMTMLLARGTRAHNLVIVVSQACEMNCTFCPTVDRVNIHLRPSGEEWQFDDLRHQISRGRELGASTIDFGGNDVLRYPRILELFEACREAGYTRIVAQSPGQLIGDRAFAEGAARSALTQVDLPLYGTTAAVHDAITRKPGSFDGLMRALSNLRDLGRPHVQLHTIALKSTLPHLGELIAFARDDLGLVLRVGMLRSNRQGERNIVGDMASFTELQPLIASHPEHFRHGFPPCQLPKTSRRVEVKTASGEGRPLNLYDLGLPDGCEDAQVALERVPTYPSRCEACQAREACGGVLGNYLEVFGDGELVPFTTA